MTRNRHYIHLMNLHSKSIGFLLLCIVGCQTNTAHEGNTDSQQEQVDTESDTNTHETQPSPLSWPIKTEYIWSSYGPERMVSSPSARDLDNDGVNEIFLGGGNDYVDNPMGYAFSFDGATGALNWQIDHVDEAFSTPLLYSNGKDAVSELIIGGRGGQVKRIKANDGSTVWTLDLQEALSTDGPWNTYTCQLIRDIDGDELPDLLTAYGGDSNAAPDNFERPPGYIVVISAKHGQLLSYIQVPDGAESYMSPLVYERGDAGEQYLLFGTGGETTAGSLWTISLNDVLNNDNSTAIKLVDAGNGRGMIAPPSLADFNDDGQTDIVVATFGGRLIMIDGTSLETVWETKVESAETYVSPALGYFNDDKVPDVCALFNIGKWPQYTGQITWVLDGRDGNLLFDKESDYLTFSSPVAADIDADGLDEIIYSRQKGDYLSPDTYSTLVMVDPMVQSSHSFAKIDGFTMGSPWLGDLDQDGNLDLLMTGSHITLTNGEFEFTFSINRWNLLAPIPHSVSWGGYLGTSHNGHLTTEQ